MRAAFVQGTLSALPPSKGGALLVERAADQVEWEGSGTKGTSYGQGQMHPVVIKSGCDPEV